MGFVLEMRVKIKNSVTTSIRTCYRSLCNHPILVVFLLFLTFLHRFFPLVFSILVTASPVLVCSFILLGTLLIIGQQNLPETEREKKTVHDFASLRTWISGDDSVIWEREGRCSTDTFPGKMRNFADMSIEEVSCSRFSSDHEGSIGYIPLIDETFHHTLSEKIELDSKKVKNERLNYEKFGVDSIMRDLEAIEKPASHKGDNSESSRGGGGGDDEASDFGSDRADSSSPDASIEDVLAILDELHPLLDMDSPLPAQMSNDDSGVGSDSSNDSNESDEGDSVIRGGEVDDIDGYEEEAHDGKEDESKSAIKWTEDDQKNLRDLGNLELERNQCLENLITRRRASKSFSLAAEKNLIDLDSAENPFNITPISTTRQNPFDLSHDSHNDPGLPPIPGSAPSTSLPRRNPFDLSYAPKEETHELKEDHVEPEFVTFPPNNTLFCRHQSFSLGPSRPGVLKWGPVFVPEQLASEGTSYWSYQRLPSDSKLSSNPDTELVSSGEDRDERKFSEGDLTKEAEVISNIYQASDLVDHRSHSFEDLDSLEMEELGRKHVLHDEPEIKLGKAESENTTISGTGLAIMSSGENRDERKFSEGDLPEEAEEISNIYQDSDLVDHRSHSFEDLDSLEMEEPGKKDVLYDEPEIKLGKVKSGNTSLSDTGGLAIPVEHITSETHLKPAAFEEKTSNNSSLSSLSEVDEKCSDLKQDESKYFEPFEREAQTATEIVDDIQHKEPVYDSSPTGSQKVLSFNSISSDNQAEISEVVTLSSSAELHGPLVHKALDSDLHGRTIEKDTAGNEEIVATSKLHTTIENQRSSGESNRLHKNLDAKAASPDSSPQYVSLKERTPVEQEKNSVLSDMSTVGPCFDDHNTLPEPPIILSESKEKDNSSIIQQMNAMGYREVRDHGLEHLSPVTVSSPSKAISSRDKASSVQNTVSTEIVQEQVSEANEPHSKEESVEVGTNAPVTVKEDASSKTAGESIHENAPKKSPEANVHKQPKSSKSEVESSTMDPSKHFASSNLNTAAKETADTPNSPRKVSEANPGEQPKASNLKVEASSMGSTKDVRSSNAETEIEEPVATNSLNKVSEAHRTELRKPSNSNVGLIGTGTNTNAMKVVSDDEQPKPAILLGSIAEITSSSTETGVNEPVTTNSTKKVAEANTGEQPEESNSKVETSSINSTKELTSSNSETGPKKTVTTNTPKKVPEANQGELREPSHANEGLTVSGTNTISLKQDSEANAGDQPNPSNSNVETSSMGSTKDLTSSNAETDIKEPVTTPNSLNKVSDPNQSELPKPSNSNVGLIVSGTNTNATKVVSDANVDEQPKPANSVASIEEITSSRTGTGVKEPFTTNSMKKVSEANQGELHKPSNVNEGLTGSGTNTISPKQDSEANAGDQPKPSNSNVETTSVESIEDNKSSNTGTGVNKLVITPNSLKKVSGNDLSELPKSSNSKDVFAKEATHDAADFKTVPSPPKQVSTSNLGQLPNSSNSENVSNKVETSDVVSVKELASYTPGIFIQEALPTPDDVSVEVKTNAPGSTMSVQETATTPGKLVPESNMSELLKLPNSKDRPTQKVTSSVGSIKSVRDTITAEQVLEGNIGETLKPSISEGASTDVGSNAVDTTKKLAPGDMRNTIQESITTNTKKNVAEGGAGEVRKPSNSKVGVDDEMESTKAIPSSTIESGVPESNITSEGEVGEVPKPSIFEQSNAYKLPKPTIPIESNAGESQNPPPDSKGWFWWPKP